VEEKIVRRIEEFKKFHEHLIKHGINPHYIPILPNDKRPATRRSWKEVRLTYEEALMTVKNGNNVAIVPDGTFLVIDIDCKPMGDEALENREELINEFLSKFPETFAVRTPSGSYHLYYFNDGSIKNHDVNDKKIHYYEVRVSNRYVLIPGSEVNGNLYMLENTKPIIQIGVEDLPAPPQPLPSVEEEGGEEPTSPPFFNRHGWSLEDIVIRQPKLARLLTDIHPEEYPSPSEADMALAVSLVFWEFDYKTYCGIMRYYRSREKDGKPRLERGDYLERTWRKAVELVDGKTISQFVDVRFYNPASMELPVYVYDVKELQSVFEPPTDIDPVTDQMVVNMVSSLDEGHFLRKYFNVISSRTDAYPEYILTCGLFALSVSTGNLVVIPRSTGILKPNLFVLLIGYSTVSRKTTVTEHQLAEVLREVFFDEEGATEFSPEGLLSSLSENATQWAVWDEFGRIINVMKQTWGESLRDLLMRIYSGQNYSRKLRKNAYKITDPFFNVISSTTPVKILKMTEDFIYEGFLPRFLVVFPRRNKQSKPMFFSGDIGKENENLARMLANIRENLRRMSAVSGVGSKIHVLFTDEATELVNDIFSEYEKEIEKIEDMEEKEIMSVLNGRSFEHLLKLSVLLRIGEPDLSAEIRDALSLPEKIVVNTKHVRFAHELVEKIYKPYSRVLVDEIMSLSESNKVNRVLSLVKKHGTIGRSRLLKLSKLTKREFDEVIETLRERGEILVAVDGKGEVYAYKEGIVHEAGEQVRG